MFASRLLTERLCFGRLLGHGQQHDLQPVFEKETKKEGNTELGLENKCHVWGSLGLAAPQCTILLMDKILHDPKDPKLWELWYIPYNG